MPDSSAGTAMSWMCRKCASWKPQKEKLTKPYYLSIASCLENDILTVRLLEDGGFAAGIGSMFFDLTNPAYITSAPFTFAFKFVTAVLLERVESNGTVEETFTVDITYTSEQTTDEEPEHFIADMKANYPAAH